MPRPPLSGIRAWRNRRRDRRRWLAAGSLQLGSGFVAADSGVRPRNAPRAPRGGVRARLLLRRNVVRRQKPLFGSHRPQSRLSEPRVAHRALADAAAKSAVVYLGGHADRPGSRPDAEPAERTLGLLTGRP